MAESSNREKDIFLAALDLSSPAERAALIANACGSDEALRRQVEAMLQAHAAPDSYLEKPAAAWAATVDSSPGSVAAGPEERQPSAAPGTRVGRYKLLQQIGEGGMGVVYMAEQQEPVRRVVALKIIKPGMDSGQVLARFEAERQALALMDHPSIARVLDAGATTDGRPFFVMELVKGTPITTFCDERRLTPRERLALFVPVCQAIQHAHQKGVIHRDIKPSNVLVALYDDKPVPKVIDFGVAKAAGQPLTELTLHTGFGAIVGTPEYMSPEQATFNQLDIDTRSDVYSLGVLLYELLTGTTPVDKTRLKEAALLEVLRVVREEEPPMPSVKLSTTQARATISAARGVGSDKLAQLLRGELDWIVMKSLEKNRNRRYETAAGLARDVDRYLNDELVEARPPSAGYRLRKFVKRHSVMVAMAAIVLFFMVKFIIGATWFMYELRREIAEADQARREETIQRQLANDNLAKAIAAERHTANALKQARDNEAKALAAEEHTAKALTRNAGLRLLLQSEKVRPSNPSLAMLLAIEGAERYPGLLANNALLGAVDESREERMIPGGGDGALCFSADGRRLLIATAANFGLWDMSTGKELVTFEEIDDDKSKHVFASACFDPDGKRILTTTEHGRVRLWDAATGKALYLLEAGAKPGEVLLQSASPAQFSPDGQFVLTTYNGVRLWDTLAGKEHSVLKGQDRPVFFAAFSKDGKFKGHSANALVMACFNPDNLQSLTVERSPGGRPGRLCRLWDTQTGKELATLDALPGFPEAQTPPWADPMLTLNASAGFPMAQFSPDGNRILILTQIVGEMEPDWHFYDATSGKHLGRVKSYFSATAAFSPDGDRVAFFGQGSKAVELWNAKTMERIASLGHGSGVSAVAFSPDGQRLATTDAAGVHLWAIAGEAERRLGRWTQFKFLALSPDGRSLATRTLAPQEVAIWDLATAREIVRIKSNEFSADTSARFSQDGRKIILGHGGCAPNDATCVGDVRTGQVVAVLRGNYLRDTDISPDGLRALTNEGDRRLTIWDLATEKKLASWTLGLNDAFLGEGAVRFSPDGRWIVTGQVTGPRLRDATTGKEVALLRPGTARVRFSPDGRRLLTFLGPAKSTRAWDVATRNELAILDVVGADVIGMGDPVFSSDGEWISLICYDGKRWSVRVWEAATGKKLLVLQSPGAAILAASFSPDKTQIVTAWADKTVRLWDARTGEPLAVFHGHQEVVRSAEFIPEGRVLSVDFSGSARIWPINPLLAARARASRELTPEERKQYEVPTAKGR